MILKLEDSGYSKQDARARVCQDIVLKAISQSVFSNNVTIKGGVLMTKDNRYWQIQKSKCLQRR